MTAREMFEELNYMPEQTYDVYTLRFVHPMKEYGMKVVEFDLTERVYSVLSISVSGNATTAYIYPELHQAIHQQMIELGLIK